MTDEANDNSPSKTISKKKRLFSDTSQSCLFNSFNKKKVYFYTTLNDSIKRNIFARKHVDWARVNWLNWAINHNPKWNVKCFREKNFLVSFTIPPRRSNWWGGKLVETKKKCLLRGVRKSRNQPQFLISICLTGPSRCCCCIKRNQHQSDFPRNPQNSVFFRLKISFQVASLRKQFI
jgi:hypothetical protein